MIALGVEFPGMPVLQASMKFHHLSPLNQVVLEVEKVEVMVGKEQLQGVVEVEPHLKVFGMNQMLKWILEVCVV